MSADVATTAPVAGPVADPVAAIQPDATVAEAAADPVRPTETAALVAESRPETTGEAGAAAAAATAPTKEKVGDDAAKITAQPINEGTLAYKGPGLLKNLIYSKKHFWFGDEPLSHETLTTYLKSEKDKVSAHHNAAHATETGKGLLFFSKRHEDKDAPEGIINLGDAVSVTREPGNKFSFKVHEKTYNFHAPTKAECESWVVSVETAVKEAAANKEVVINGEKYKLTKEKLAKPAAVTGAVAAGAAGTAAAASVANKEKVHDGTAADSTTATASPAKEEKKEEKKEDDKARSSSKGRSSSRKRQSIFGSLIGKKDDKAVEQANEKEAAKDSKAEEAKETKAAETTETDKPSEAAAVAPVAAVPAAAAVVAAEEEKKTEEPAPVAEAAATEEKKAEEPAEEPAAKSKRASVFGFFNKKSGDVVTAKDLKKEEAAPSVPAKDTPATTDAAPQLGPVDTTTASEATPVVAGASETAAAPEATGVAAEPHKSPLLPVEATPEAKAANRQKEGGDLFSFMKKKKAEHDVQKAEDKTEGAAAAEKTEGTSPTATNEKRRSSFFNALGGKKERATSPEGDKKGLGGLFRKASKSQKPASGPVTDSAAPPAVPKVEDEAVTAAAPLAAEAEAPVAASTEAAPVTEAAAAAQTDVPIGTTTGTDGLPVTEIKTEAAPVAAATTA